mmetsp:Transcript_17958/g.26369  ORF Transcript_17958/g.26369 Transcript_17958/m.26369 type:complete len:986 (+) Transcript_17958:187-3144(+)
MMMSTIEEELMDEFSESAAIPTDSSDDDDDDGISEASSSVFIDLQDYESNKLLTDLSEDRSESLSVDEELLILGSPDPTSGNPPAEISDKMAEQEENQDIEMKLSKINDAPSEADEVKDDDEDEEDDNPASILYGVPENYSQDTDDTSASTAPKTYDLGGADKDKSYDLGGGDSKKFDLSSPSAGSTKDKKYDLSSYLSTTKVASKSVKDDDTRDTRTTLQRSGSTAMILHKWLKDRDWTSARTYLSSPKRYGKRLQDSVSFKNDDGETALHIACRRKAPYDVVRMITNIGGMEAVIALDTFGESLPLHHACHFCAPLEVIQLLVYLGGKKSVKQRDAIGNLPLHWALSKKSQFESVKLLIDIGGHETVNSVNRIGWNSLHAATYFRSNHDVIKLLVETGGKDIVNAVTKKDQTPLDLLYLKNSFDTESIQVVQNKMGEDTSLLTCLPTATVSSTLDWVKRQTGVVQENSFDSPCIQMMLNELFVDNRFLAVLMIDFCAQVMLAVTLSFAVTKDDLLGYSSLSFLAYNLLFYSTTWLGIRLLMSMVAIPIKPWVGEFSNWLSGFQIALAVWSITIISQNGMDEWYEAVVIVLTAGIVWFRLVFVVGDLFYSIAVFAFALQRIVVKLVGFLATSTLVVVGFAHMIHVAAHWEERNCLGPEISGVECQSSNLDDAYYRSFTEFLNPGALFLDESLRDNKYHTVLMFAFAVVIELLLLNVLIAEIVNSLKSARERGKRNFWQKRFNLIVELGNIYKQSSCKSKCSRSARNTGIPGDDKKESTSTKRGSSKMPLSRFAFLSAHYELFPGDFYSFRKWWILEETAPNFVTRLTYFLKWASLDEILLPGHSFERVLSGKGKDANSYLWRFVLYCIFPVMICAHLICFLGGLVSFGVFWPKWMKKALFSGIIDKKSKQKANVQHLNVMRNEIRAISNEFKMERFSLGNMEKDVRNIQNDLKKMKMSTLRSHDSVYTEEDELSEILSSTSEEA